MNEHKYKYANRPVLALFWITAILLLTVALRAQTIQDLFDKSTSTNAAIDLEYLRGLHGNKNIAAATYAYGLTTNAALLVSYDRAWTHADIPEQSHSDMLKGGLSLSTTLTPLKTWGLTNFVLRIGGYEEAGSVTSGTGSGKLVNVAGAFTDSQIRLYKAVYFHFGGLFQNRTEEGYFNGNYAGIRAGIGGSF